MNQVLDSPTPFTLIEALLSCLMLVTIATIVASVFFTGLQVTDDAENRMVVDSALRSQMDFLLGNNLADLTDGATTVAMGDAAIPLTWSVLPIDMDSDGTAETDAWRVTVFTTVGNRSLSMLVVGTQGRVGKL